MDTMEYQLLVLIMASSLIALALLGTFTLIGIKMLKSNKKRTQADLDDEVRMIQEIYQGLTRMEQRVDALETILFDRSSKEK